MNERKRRGDWGEEAVAAALERRGYSYSGAAVPLPLGEIDLIVRSEEGILCFVEVKTRSPGAIALPRESVTAAKQEKLRRAASWYLAQTGLDCPCRFDVAEVVPSDVGGGPQINYITSAF